MVMADLNMDDPHTMSRDSRAWRGYAWRQSLMVVTIGGVLLLAGRGLASVAPLLSVSAAWLWMMLPGYILTQLLTRRLSWPERLPMAFVLGKGLATPYIVLGIIGHWRLTTLFACSVGLLGFSLLLDLAWKWRQGRAPAPTAPDTESHDGERHVGIWLLTALVVVMVGVLAYDAARWPVHGDDLSVMPFSQDVLTQGYITDREPFHGTTNRVLTRQELIVTVYQQTLLTWQTGLEPAIFYVNTRIILIALAFLGLYTLLQQTLKQRHLALFILALWAIYLLATLLVEQTGSHLVTRIAQDKFEGWFIVIPPTLIFLLWYLDSQSVRYLIGFAVATVGATLVHAITLPQLMILGGSAWLLHLIFVARSRRERLALGGVLLVYLVCLSVPIIEYIRFTAEKEILDALGLLQLDKLGRYHLAIFWERLLLLSRNRFIVSPATILQPINYVGYAALPILFTQVKRNHLARLIVGTMLLLPCLIYIPFLAGLVGLLVPASLMWRLAWPFPLLSTITLGWAFWLAAEWLWGRRGKSSTPLTRSGVVLVGLVGMILAFWGSLRISLPGYEERVAVETFSACSRAKVLRAYLNELSQDRPINVLSTGPLNECFPSYAAQVNVVDYRSIATMARLYYVESAEQTVQRVYDVAYFSTTTLLDGVLADTLTRHQIDYVVLERDRLFLDLQIRYQPDQLTPVYQDATYTLYAVNLSALPSPIILGNTALREQRWKDAERQFSAALSRPGDMLPAHMGLALAYEGLGDLGKALAEWQTAAKIAPAEPAVWQQLGITYWLRQAAPAAVDAFTQAVALAPERAPLHTQLGMAYWLADQPDAAWESYRRGIALKMPENSARYYDLLANTLAASGWPAAAERSFQLAYSVEPIPFRLTQIGVMQLQQGKLSEAESAESAANRHDPWFSLPHIYLAAIYRQSGRLTDAIRAYESAIRLDPTDRTAFRDVAQIVKRQSDIQTAMDYSRAWLGLNTILPGPHDALADLLAELGQPQNAIPELEFGRQFAPINSSYNEAIGDSYMQLNEFALARQAYQAALVTNPQSQPARDGLNRLDGRNQGLAYQAGPLLASLRRNPAASQPFISLAELYRLAGDWEKARDTLQWAVRLEPLNPSAFLEQGDLYRSHGQWSEAQAAYEQAAALRPTDAEAYRRLSEVKRAQGDIAAATATLAQAAALDPDSAETLLAQGDQALHAGHIREAQQYYQQAIDRHSHNALPYLAQSNLLRDQGENQAALDTLGAALSHGVNDPVIYSALAGLHLSLGKPEAVLNWLQAGVDNNPLSAVANISLAQEYARRAQWAPAIAAYAAALRLDPQALNALLSLGSLYEARGDPDQALANYQAAVAAVPSSGWAQVTLGNFYQRRGRLAEAVNAYQTAQSADPTYVDGYLALGGLYSLTEQRDLAATQYQRAAAVYPGSVAAWAALGDFYNTQGQVDAAIVAYQKGADLDPTSAGLWSSLADAYQQSGQFVAAFDAQKRPTDLEPGNAGAWLALAQMHLNRSQLPEAEAALQRALATNALFTEAQTTLADLWLRQGKTAQAITLYNDVIAQNPGSADGYLRLAALALSQRAYAEAISHYRAALAVKPTDGRSYLGLADVYTQQGDLAGAEQALQDGLAQLPGSAELYERLGNLYLSQGQEQAAETAYRQTFNLAGNRASNHIALGGLRQQQGDVEAARQEYAAAIAAQPDNARGYLALANLYLAEGDWDKLNTTYQQAIAVLPGSDALAVGFSRALATQGDLPAALTRARQGVEINPSSGNLIALGQAQENLGQYAEAQNRYTQAIAADRSQPEGYIALGRLRARLGQFESAETAYRQAIAVTYADAEPYGRLGDLQQRQGRLSAAEESYRLSVAADSSNVDSLLRLAAFLTGQGRRDEALATYQAAIAIGPTRVDARLALANWYAGQGDFVSAENELRATVDAFPDTGLAIDALADFTANHGGWDEAEKLYQRLLSLPGSILDGHLSLGNLYNVRGRLAEAEAAFQAAIETQPGNARGYLALASFYTNLSRWDEAAAIYNQALRLMPTVDALYVGLTNLQSRQGLYEAAVTTANAGRQQNPTSLELIRALGDVYVVRGDRQLAVALYTEMLAQSPGATSLYLAQGAALEAELDWAGAQAAYTRTLELAPTNAQAWLGMGETADALGDETAAVNYLHRAAQAGVNDPVTLTAIGKVHLAAHRDQTAAEVFRLALTSNATYIGAQVGLGQALEAQGLNEEAQAAYDQAVAVNPGSPQALTALGNFQTFTLRQPEEAVTLFQRALAVDPNYLGAHIGLGKAYDAAGDFEAGLAAYQAGVATNPHEALAYSALGNAYLARNDLDSAVATHQEAVAQEPQSAQAHLALGSALEQAGRSAEAITAYQTAAALDPGSASAHLALGNIYSLQGQVTKAVAEYEAAIAVDPTFGGAYERYGQFYYNQGQYAAAVPYLTKATELDSESVTGPFFLALAHEQLGNTVSAEFYFQKTLSRNPAYAPALQGLGRVSAAAGNYTEAVAYYEAAGRIDRSSANYLAIGNIYKNDLNQLDQAAAAYQQGLQLDPLCELCYIYLGDISVTRGALDEALTTYQAGIDAGASTGFLHNAAGAVYYKQGRYTEARDAYEAAVRLNYRIVGAYNAIITVYTVGFVGQNDLVAHYETGGPYPLWQETLLGYIFGNRNYLDTSKALAYFHQVEARDPAFTAIYRPMALLYENLGDARTALIYWQKFEPGATGSQLTEAQQHIANLQSIHISGPADNAHLSGTVEIRGSVKVSNFQFYKVEYGAGLAPTNWYSIGDGVYVAPVQENVLAYWDVTGVSPGQYTLRLTVVYRDGNTAPAYSLPVFVNQ